MLRRSEFEKVYEAGRRHNSPFFAAFALKTGARWTRVGFTAPRSVGKSVRRNRIKRRLREAVRKHLAEAGAGWDLVFNVRRAALDAEFSRLEGDVSGLFGALRRNVG